MPCNNGDFAPRRFLSNELVKLVFQAKLGIEGIGRDRKAVLVRKDLTKRGTAYFAEASAILVRVSWFIERDMFFAVNPPKVFPFHKYNGAGTDLPAPRTMTRTHG